MDIITATIVALDEHKRFLTRRRPACAWAKPHHLSPAELRARREALAVADDLAAIHKQPRIIYKGELFTQEQKQ